MDWLLTRLALLADKPAFRGLSEANAQQMEGTTALPLTEEQFTCFLTYLQDIIQKQFYTECQDIFLD